MKQISESPVENRRLQKNIQSHVK
jgi:hypothetical protein